MKITVLCDFDGTITTEDIGDIITLKFASEHAKEYAKNYYLANASMMEVDSVVYSSMKQTKKELIQCASESAVIRDGFFEFLVFCKLNDIDFTVISAGYYYYINAILGKTASDIVIKANEIDFAENGDKTIIPLRFNSTCGRCGNCKLSYCDEYLGKVDLIVYIGDSVSDVCAVQNADLRFARDKLKKILDEKKLDYYSYDTFFDIMDILKDKIIALITD